MPSFILIIYILIMFLSCCSCQQDQDEHQYLIRTIEKLPVHTEVVNLRRLLFGKDFSENKNVDFSLAKRDEFPYMYFLINHSSRGILTIRKEIDRDELCRLRRCRCDTWCDLELEIIINSQQFNIELITIRIIDRNDHKPIFLNNQINLTIVENAQIGAMIKLESAIDYDQGQNSIVGYSLVSSTSLPFSLRYDLIRGDLSLVIDQALDRELISLYKFDIIAHDGDNQTGFLHVFVSINDINDNPPKFDQPIYLINNISESISINSILCRVHANDPDEGINGEINYYLINQDNCFDIDHITGDIRLKCLLDYETQKNYRLEIEARDRGEGYKTDFSTVFINIFDENDNYPIIDIYPDPNEIHVNSIKIYLNESLPINSLLLSLTIIDYDSGDNGRVRWNILPLTIYHPFELIYLTETTGELRTKDRLDRELRSEYNLTIEAHDYGKPFSKSTYLNLNIVLLDENDNRPIFKDKNLTITLNEHVKINNSYGYEIYHVQAYDSDQGLNGEIIYSLINNKYKNLFSIDSHTGILRALKEFDRNQQEFYVLHIKARDKGSPPLSSEQLLTIQIINRNEYTPICNIQNNTNNISWSIIENSPMGTIVGLITCTDDDKDELNGKISVYYQWIREETKYPIPFDIITRKNGTSQSPLSVIVSVNGTIDREQISFYSLFLTIYDHGNPRRLTNYSISINIIDENDNCPQLHIDSSFILINRDITPNYFFIHLIATDKDKDSNGNLTFQLSLSTSPKFIHLYSNGTLYLHTNSNLIEENSFIFLHIQIRDYGKPTPCFIVETLRLFIGTNKTDWLNLIKTNNYDDTSLRLSNEEYQQGKRMIQTYSSSISSPLFKYNSSISSRKQLIGIFIGTAILMFIVILTIILCFIDCIQKKSKPNSNSLSMIKTNGILNHDNTLTVQSKNFYDDNLISHQHYKNVKLIKPVLVIASSNSHSLSSIDSTTRANTAHNRAITNTYTYTALSTSDDLMPVDFDDNINNLTDDNGLELMMTTV